MVERIHSALTARVSPMADHNDLDAETYHQLAAFEGDWRDQWWHDDFLALCAARWELSAVHRVLDVGCGAGHWGLRLLPLCAPDAQLVGVDREKAFLADARARADARGLAGRCTWAVAHGESLPFDDGAFDLVTCQTVLMHAADARDVLTEMVRVTRPGGLVLAAEPENAVGEILYARAEPRGTLDETLAIVRLYLTAAGGKRALGHGDEDIAGRLPGLFAAAGLGEVRCLHNDKTAVLVPPYEHPHQKRDVEVLLGFWTGEDEVAALRALYRSRFLAGGGTEADFETCWTHARARQLRSAEALRAGTFTMAGGHAHYAISGRRPAP